ncbi:MAG: hypothetical protein QOC81_189 [Thermoanaerobaculia bacterium]|jgi:hypothetical protein|nr:hypothetical protein [Thermoanaerobaculia bacterium]
MNAPPSSWILRVLIVSAIVVTVASNVVAFTTLGYRAIALRVLNASSNKSEAYPQFLSKVTGDKTFNRYFLAGTFIWSEFDGAVSRVAARSILRGDESMQLSTIQSVDGQYARWNRGTLHGIRPGLPVRIFRQGQEIGRGRATDVRSAESDIEIDSVSGVAEISVGDEVQVEMGSGRRDVLQP